MARFLIWPGIAPLLEILFPATKGPIAFVSRTPQCAAIVVLFYPTTPAPAAATTATDACAILCGPNNLAALVEVTYSFF